jgi:type II secretory pathway predicted ATPase ExeA
MYESFFRFSHRPFAAAPAADAFFPAAAIDHARLTLVRCIDRAEGPATLIGPAGTGKSLLLQVLAQHFEGRFQIALLGGARLSTRRALLQNILFELRRPYRDLDENELRLSLIDYLEPREEDWAPEGMLLLVDEAHSLPLRLLDELRLIGNQMCDGNPRVRLVLAGSSQLEERLASPKLESFHQRIAARCYLQSLTRDETIGYVQQQIAQAGGIAEAVFTGDALRSLHTATDGIPRLINQVCDHALLLASAGGQRELGPDGIAEAWADLQQLPAPWHESARQAAEAPVESIIEFGNLADESAEETADERASGDEEATDERSFGSRTLAFEPQDDAIASAELHLAQIDSGLSSIVRADGLEGDFDPANDGMTEIELVFQRPDPFGSNWDEEEVVIDRYASLEADSLVRRPKVRSSEGRQIGAALEELRDEIAKLDQRWQVPQVEGPVIHPPAAAADFNPARDPVYAEAPAKNASERLKSLAPDGGDDRDIIVIEESEDRPHVPSSVKVRRQEYRRLFSSLRNRD